MKGCELQHLSLSEYKHLAETFEVEGRAAKQVAAFRNLVARPNAYTALHYKELATEYTTPRKCTNYQFAEDKYGCIANTTFYSFELGTKDEETLQTQITIEGDTAHKKPLGKIFEKVDLNFRKPKNSGQANLTNVTNPRTWLVFFEILDFCLSLFI